MTGSADCRDIRHALGVYVLGAIDPAERTMVDIHLSMCPDCREELAGLAGLPALLRRVPVAEAQQVADDPDDELPGMQMPSDQVLRSLLARTARARQARRWRVLATAAAVILVAGTAGAAGWGALHPSGTPAGSPPVAAHFTSASASNPRTHVTATVRYAPKGWGTVLDTQVVGLPTGARCQLEVTDSTGHTTVVGGWKTTYDEGSTWYPGSSSVTLDSLHSFEITSHGKVLVTVPVR
ncbi:MAG TPA: zf-HC2 domain-containing protein [Streptosporangiaceae bacterium]|nr:zf-HC2 domain-containing protein [Streptosporangiaceae bacterium]